MAKRALDGVKVKMQGRRPGALATGQLLTACLYSALIDTRRLRHAPLCDLSAPIIADGLPGHACISHAG